MNRLRIVIADDEPLVRRGIKRLLRGEPDVVVAGEAGDGDEAIDVIRSTQPDLILLDVQMPERDGFAVLDALRPDPLPAVVFVTAHDAHAIRAFDHHAVDYLLKPFDGERFHLALSRVRSRLAERTARTPDPRLERALGELRKQRDFLDRVLVKHDGRASVVAVSEIDWLEAADNYVRLHTARARYLIRGQIGAMERQLDPKGFVRVHRSTIANVARIRELHPLFGGDYEIRLTTGARLRLSRGYRDRFRAVVRQLGGSRSLLADVIDSSRTGV